MKKAVKSITDTRKIAVYARKSKITETGKSIEIQKEKCIALACAQFNAAEEDLIIYEDEGKSGFYADRPQYKRMLHDIEHNKLKAVVCYKIDRISRRTVDLLNLVQQMEQKGISFVSVSDRELDTSTRTGKIMISLLSAIAEFERDIITERITDNMYELAKEGRWMGGECPLGYASKKEKLIVHGKRSTANHLAPVPEEQFTVKRVFALFLRKGSLTGTAAALNKEGYHTKKGKAFTLIAVKNILMNPVYAIADGEMRRYFETLNVPVWADEIDFDGLRGIMAYNKTEQVKEMDVESKTLDPRYIQKNARRHMKDWVIAVGKHAGIISGAEWVKVQQMLAEIAQNNAARPKGTSKALLSGLVRCAECGGKMFVRTESGRYNADGSLRFRYICDAKYRKKGGCDKSPNIKGYELDHFVVEQLSHMHTNENDFYKALYNLKDALLIQSTEAVHENAALKKRLTQIDAAIQSQIVNLRTAPDSVKSILYADLETLHKEREDQQQRVNQRHDADAAQDSRTTAIEKARKIILDFPRLMEQADYEGKLRLLHQVLEGVVVAEETVHIFLKGSERSIHG